MVKQSEYLIETKGLREMRKALSNISRDYRLAFDRELRKITKPIVAEAKVRYRRHHPRQGRTEGSQRGIRGSAAGASAKLFLGSQRYPYLLGQEWGSGKYPQFPARKVDGYFFWMAAVEGAGEAAEAIDSLIERSNRLNFPGRP